MKYKLTIVELIPNPDFAEQQRKWDERSRYSNINEAYPVPMSENRTLEIELRDNEYQAVRKAVLEQFGGKIVRDGP